MNILFLDQFPHLGGAQGCFLDLLPAFHRRGWKVQAIVLGDGPFPKRLRSMGVEVEIVSPCALSSAKKPVHEAVRYSRWCPDTARAIHRVAVRFLADLLYVNGPRVLPPTSWIARGTGIPLLFHAHNRLPQRMALALTGRSLKFARAKVIACCEYVADSLRRYLPPLQLDVVYNGVPDLYDASKCSQRRKPAIGVIGRIEPEKGQLDFVRAARIVHQTLPTANLLVIGAPLLSNNRTYYLQTLTESRELPITFTGWRDSISSILSGLDLLVVPSLSFEATPRVVIEAFSARVPVLAYASGGIPEIVQDGLTGLLVHTPSPEALAGRILEALREKSEVVARIITNARNAWEEKFRIDTFQRQVCDNVVQCVQAAPRRSLCGCVNV